MLYILIHFTLSHLFKTESVLNSGTVIFLTIYTYIFSFASYFCDILSFMHECSEWLYILCE